ncbi:histidine phosphatase family protein [Uliginosibacterium sp. H1]|uniref:histidine phosphatase family protein n=1 Tax=Uliginosibacterium sp. H1 TaxID=3114757 RepID=UPI002E19F546|nr:histidine phosphatase family protein [Uliginosibacterium sp. H1]
MIAPTQFFFVRHGETSWNASRRLQGHVDIPLNANGVQQAQAAARLLGVKTFDAVLSSDLARARVTAEFIAAVRGTPVQLVAGLRERNFGMFQGLSPGEADLRYPIEQTRLRTRQIDFTPDGGESLAQFATTVTETLQGIAGRYAGGTVLCVTHGGVLDVIYRLATGRPLESARDFAINNAGVSIVSHDKEVWCIDAWNDCRHLDESRDELPI